MSKFKNKKWSPEPTQKNGVQPKNLKSRKILKREEL